MATTTNYSWTTPDDTALVKDGAAAIRTLGSSVDTTLKNLNPSTTLGDIEYRSSTANTNTRLGIGTTGQVLSVSGGVPAWTTPAAGGAGNLALITDGTLSGSSVTVSSLSTYTNIYIFIENPSWGTANDALIVRLNGSSSANYRANGSYHEGTSAYSRYDTNTRTSINLNISNNARNGAFGSNYSINLTECKNAGFTKYETNSFHYIGSGGTVTADTTNGVFEESAAVSSLTIQTANSYSFTGGTYKIYGA